MEENIHYYRIAEYYIKINFKKSDINNEYLLPSFSPFKTETACEELFFELTVDDSIIPIDKDNLEKIGDFDTGNGIISVCKSKDASGTYQYIINNINGHNCCLLQAYNDFSYCRCALNGNTNMRMFGLNNALMIVFAFKGSFNNTLLIHASTVCHKNYAYAFIAKSGTGKSTHSSLWLRYIPECELINDDNPIIRIIDGTPYLYGSPWSGKTPCYRNIKVKLGGITRIDRAERNSINKLSPTEAFASLLPSCSTMKWDKVIFGNICSTISLLIERTNIYTLHCLPDKEAAVICHRTISK